MAAEDMTQFLEQHNIATFPTKEALVASGVDLGTLLGWQDDDFRLFFELHQIPKGPQLILKHAVKAQQQMMGGAQANGGYAQGYEQPMKGTVEEKLPGSWMR